MARWAVIISGILLWSHVTSAQRAVVTTWNGDDTDRVVEALLARRITLTLTNVSVIRAVDSISRSAKVLVQYQLPLLAARKTPISVKLVNTPVGVALERVLDGTGLHVVSDGQGLLLIVPVSTAGVVDSVPATGTVVGRVVDSTTGHGLLSVTIKVAGMKISALTQDSGRFTLRNVPVGQHVLTIKGFGYRPSERTVNVTAAQATSLRVTLVAVPNVLSGVVTTAVGQQRKIEVGNDITTINVDSVMKVAPILTVTDLLETRVPGLTVQHTSGAPGDPSRIRLRGASSIYGNNDPIVVVDGIRVYASQSDKRNDNLAPSAVGRNTRTISQDLGASSSVVNPNGTGGYSAPSPLDQIDPNSIETVEVLKGPSASALYGSDAANGVIVITTKHGRAGPTHWGVTASVGLNEEPGQWPVNYYRFGSGYVDPGLGEVSSFCQWNDQTCIQDSIVGFQALNDRRYTVFADHGSDATYSGSVSGGTPMLQYSLTGSGTKQVGLIKLPGVEEQRFEKFYNQPVPGWMKRPQNYQTWSVGGQLNAQPSAGMNVTLSSTLFNSNQQNSSLENAVNQLQGIYINAYELSSNPLAQQFVERALDHQLSSTNVATVQWRPVSWLQPILAQGGINTIQRTDQTYIPYGVNSTVTGNPNLPQDTTGFYGLGRGTSQVNTFNLSTGTPTFVNRLSVTFGTNLVNTSIADVQASTSQLAPGVSEPSSFPTTLINGFSPSTFGQSSTRGSTYGFYVTSQIHLLGNMYLNPGFRSDGGTALGANAGLTALPKIDLSYLVIDQNHPRFDISLLRPRLAIGRAETEPGLTDRLRLFNGTTPTSLNGDTSYVQYVPLSTLGNSQLVPEQSTEFEGGLDLGLWQDRVSLTWTGYNKTRRNAIVPIQIAPSVSGGGSVNINVGEIRDTGHELTLNAQVFQSRALGWTVGGNFSTQRNLVVRLNKGESTIDFSNGTRIEVGYPLFGRWAQPISAFADANHDGILEANEVGVADSAVYVGQQTPKYQMNFNTGLTLLNGRLGITATFAYINGMTQFNDGALASGMFVMLPNAPGTSLVTQAAVAAATGGGVCSGAGDVGDSPYGSNHGFVCSATTDIGVMQTINTLRFNNLSINYSLPRSISSFFRVPGVSLALQGSNLALHSNYRGKDPGVNAFSTVTGGDQVEDLGQLPQPRTWRLQIRLGN